MNNIPTVISTNRSISFHYILLSCFTLLETPKTLQLQMLFEKFTKLQKIQIYQKERKKKIIVVSIQKTKIGQNKPIKKL